MTIHLESVSNMRAEIAEGLVTSEEIVRSCLNLITATDETIKAWAYLDPEGAISQAQMMDELRQKNKMFGSMHGIPVGIKDIFDVAGLPCEYGSAVYAGRVPENDCTVVSKLREAGAVIMGKTVTAEFAVRTPGATVNPHDPTRTPGGSSSGSAAAVAAGHVPLAIGSQTNGSVIRPASYCGVFGLKPSFGLISRSGVFQTSKNLDHVGVFARTLEDVAIVTDALAGYDINDPATHTRPKSKLISGCQQDFPIDPNFAYFTLPYTDKMSEDTLNGLAEMVDILGDQVEEIALPNSYTNVITHHNIIHEYELYTNLEQDYAAHPDKFSVMISEMLERGKSHSADQYAESVGVITSTKVFFEEFFHDYDAILTASALGIAPADLTITGDPICSTIWTYAGLPCLSLPMISGESGLPIGIQLVGEYEGDTNLCRTAQWLLTYVNNISNDA